MAKSKRQFKKGDKFRLVGRRIEFVVLTTYDAAGFIPAVIGMAKDGRRTCAREADIIKL